jgi:hypothetical protein
MSTYQQEMAAKGRPMGARATWELQNMVRALNMLTWLNTPEDEARRDEAKRELRIRGREARERATRIRAARLS